MPTAKKLPSGSWNCRVFSHYEYLPDGKKKRVYESFTCSDPSRRGKKECEHMASEWACSRKSRAQDKTVLDAIRTYIDHKTHVLSPSTIRGYESLYRTAFASIGSVSVRSLDSITVQGWVNSYAKTHKQKTTKNAYHLLAAALDFCECPPMRVTLPAVPVPELHTPCDDEIQKLLNYTKDKYELHLAIMLSAFGSLRRSEICALTASDINGNRIHISKAMVEDKDKQWIIKDTPKTDTSNRWVEFPAFVISQIDPETQGRLIRCTPDQLSNRFKRAIRFSKAQHFRFHDLRHYYVSIAHAIGIPDAYVMQTGGWKTDHVMKKVYRGTLDDVMRKEQDKMHEHFRDAFHDA